MGPVILIMKQLLLSIALSLMFVFLPTLSFCAGLTVGTSNGTATHLTIIGASDGNSAAVGVVGQYVNAVVESGSAVPLVSTITANVASVSLTAGDWDVSGVVNFAFTIVTATRFHVGTTTTITTLGPAGTFVSKPLSFAGLSDTYSEIAPVSRYSFSNTATVYLVADAAFSSGSISAYGTIRARRIR